MKKYFLFARQCSVNLSQSTRCLTSNQTATALRPFYFVVHPDLFGKYPKEKAVNENSLKHLNEYLEKLLHCEHVQPITLTFCIRKAGMMHNRHPPHSDHHHMIQIQLLGKSLHESVKTILRSCQLPLDYINAIHSISMPNASFRHPTRTPEAPFKRPIRWDPSFSATYGMKDPDAPDNKPATTLGVWIAKNVSLAQTRHQQTEPIRQEVHRLRNELMAMTGLRDVVWDSNWSQTQHRVALITLLRLCTLSGVSLKDQVINLCDTTGICCHGNILLKLNDVAENWLVMLQSISRHKTLLNKLPTIELYLSTLLNSAHIVRRSTRVPFIQLYISQLRHLIGAVKDHLVTYPGTLTDDLGDISIVVECITGPLLVAPSGVMHISSSTPGFLVIDFLRKHTSTARLKQLEYKSLVESCDNLVGQCYRELHLRSLAYRENITSEQVMTCCKQLLNDSKTLPVSLGGASIQIANYFSVTSEGEMCIPWSYGQSMTYMNR